MLIIMLLSILFTYYNYSCEPKIINKILVISFIAYAIMYMLVSSSSVLIYILDSTFFLKKYLDKKNVVNRQKLNTNIEKKDVVLIEDKSVNKPLKDTIDPEFQKDNYLPYTHSLKDTIIQLTNSFI